MVFKRDGVFFGNPDGQRESWRGDSSHARDMSQQPMTHEQPITQRAEAVAARMSAEVRAYYDRSWPPDAIKGDGIAVAMVGELLAELRAVERERDEARTALEAARAILMRAALEDDPMTYLDANILALDALAQPEEATS